MKPEEIKAEIQARGFTYQMIGKELGVPSSTISAVVLRNSTSTRIADALSKILQKPISEIFPDVKTYERKAKRPAKQQELSKILAS